MVVNGANVKLVQTTSDKLSSCENFGEETLIINTNGGVYLGNNTNTPTVISSYVKNGTGDKFLADDGVYKSLTDNFVKLTNNS